MTRFAPEEGSPVWLRLMEADGLEAQREALQPAYAAAADYRRSLERVLRKPRPSRGSLTTAAAAELEAKLTELNEACLAEEKIARELADLSRRVRAIQATIIDMLAMSTIDESAQHAARDRVLKRSRS